MVLLFLFLNTVWAASPANLGPDYNEIHQSSWPTSVQDEIDQSGDLASAAIFNFMDEVDFYDYAPDRKIVDFEMGRRVLENHDVARTISVVDRYKLYIQLPVYSGAVNTGAATLSWSLGTGEGIEVMDIRQSRQTTLDAAYADWLGVKARVRTWYDGYQKTMNSSSSQEGEVVLDHSASDLKGSLVPPDPFRNAQYTKLWSFLTFPTRLPLKTGWLSKLEDGEIMAYTASGAVELAVGVGWNLDPTALTTFVQAGGYVTTYLKGSYRISILKENERYARVKLTRMATVGNGLAVGGETQKTLISGIILSGIDLNLTVVPFQFAVDRNVGKSFDVGYRYDLYDPLARKAYENAVLGRFAYSEELAEGGHGTISKPPVKRIFGRTTDTHGTSSTDKLSLFIIFSDMQNSSVAISSAKVTFPDGTHRYLEATVNNRDQFVTLWGSNEKFRYKYTVFYNKDAFQQGKENSFRLMAEGFVEDTNTSGNGLYSYIDQVEAMAGQAGIFPRPPKRRPIAAVASYGKIEDGALDSRGIPYGRSSFYYRLALTEAQTMKFVATPREKMWPILEKAFGVEEGAWATPAKRALYAVSNDAVNFAKFKWLTQGHEPSVESFNRLAYAEMFDAKWESIHKYTDKAQLLDKIADLFSGRMFGYEIMRALRIALTDEKIGFIVSGSNQAFGYIWLEKDMLASDAVLQRVETEVEYDRPWEIQKTDTEAEVSDLSVNVLAPKKITFRFGSKVLPKFVYFRVDENNVSTNPIRIELVLENRDGKFKQKSNELTLDERNGQFDQTLLSRLKPGASYRVSFAISQDGVNWGRRQDLDFRYSW